MVFRFSCFWSYSNRYLLSQLTLNRQQVPMNLPQKINHAEETHQKERLHYGFRRRVSFFFVWSTGGCAILLMSNLFFFVVSSLKTVGTAIKTVTTPAKNSHLSKGPSERCRARNSVKPTRSVKTEKRWVNICILPWQTVLLSLSVKHGMWFVETRAENIYTMYKFREVEHFFPFISNMFCWIHTMLVNTVEKICFIARCF